MSSRIWRGSHLDAIEIQEQRRRQRDQLSEKDATITRLQAELEQEQLLATTFMKQRDAMQVERDQLAGEAPDLTSLPKAVWDKIVARDHLDEQAWIDSYYEQIHVSLLCRAERDQLAAEVERHIIQFRSIEASLGTLDHSEAIDDERALPDWASTKVAEIVDTYKWQADNIKQLNIAIHNQSAMLAEQSERLRKLREVIVSIHCEQSIGPLFTAGVIEARNLILRNIDSLFPGQSQPASDSSELAGAQAVEKDADSERGE